MTKINIKEKVVGKEVDLSLNELLEVPVKDLASLPKVTHIDLSCNLISSLPSAFSSLAHIIWLDFSKNRITELPENFGSLRQLQHLDLYENKLTVLPVSFCQLKSLRWLDLKNNPLNQKLKSVAGDCLDEKQCFLCAKKIVEYMKNVDSELERQKQKKLQQEREEEAIRKAEEEMELKKQKEQKKAEKLRRKAEREEEKWKEVQQNHTGTTEGKIENEENDSKKNGHVPSQTKDSSIGSLIKWLVLFAILVPLFAVCVSLGCHAYYGDHIESLAQLQQAAIEDWMIGKRTALAIWEIVVIEEKRLIQLIVSIWQQWYGSEDQLEKRHDL